MQVVENCFGSHDRARRIVLDLAPACRRGADDGRSRGGEAGGDQHSR